MDLDVLHFSEICRCCKRKEYGMTSIFNGNTHPTFPPVDEMLRSFASLNVQENDGLPSLVCTLCLNNIKKTFTFIQQLAVIEEELRLILLVTDKQGNTLSHRIYDSTNPCISLEAVKKENESTSDQASADFFESFAVHNYENIDLVVKTEVLPVSEIEEANKLQSQLEQYTEVPKLACEVCNQVFKSAENLEIHKGEGYCIKLESPSSEITISEEVIQYNCPESHEEFSKINTLISVDDSTTLNANQNLYATDIDDEGDEPEVQNDDFEDMYDIEVDEDNEDVNNADSSDSDYAPYGKGKKKKARIRTSSRRGPGRSSRTAISITGENIVESNTLSPVVDHINDSTHLVVAEGISNEAQVEADGKNVENFDDPEDEEHNYQEDVEERSADSSERQSSLDEAEDVSADNEEICPKSSRKGRKPITKIKMFTCRLCAFTTAANIERHLHTHCKEKQFACSKCNSTFARKYSLQCHGQKCNGKNHRKVHPKKASVQKKSLPLQDLQDPLKMKKYYTVTEIDVQNDVKVQGAEGRGDDVGFKEICPKSQTKRAKKTTKVTVFRCNLCVFTSAVMCGIKQHLQAHSNEHQFACSKCNQTFSLRSNMLRHWKMCDGDINRYIRPSKPKLEKALPLQDLNDPLTIKKYYSVIEIEVQTNDNDDLKVPEFEDARDVVEIEEFSQTNRRKKTSKQTSETSKINLFKCKLCTYSTAYKEVIRRHLCTHFEHKPFACSKCNDTFARKCNMLSHSRICKGKKYARYKGDTSKQMISMTLQDLKDPEKIKNCYTIVTEREMQENNDDDD